MKRLTRVATQTMRVLAITTMLVTGLMQASPAMALVGPICRVNASVVGGAGDGSTWADAFASLQLALADTNCTEIWVAAGSYRPHASDASVSFSIPAGVAVYGGFDTSATVRDDRDWTTNVTVLSGDLANDDDSNNADGNFIDEGYGEISGTNSWHVVHFDGTSNDISSLTVLDGFTITGGNAVGPFPNDGGGGVLCSGSANVCSPTLTNLNFSGNHAAYGAAMLSDGISSGDASPTLTHVTFTGNGGASYGGAMYNNGSDGLSSPHLTDVVFSGNVGDIGGAMYNTGSSGGVSSPVLDQVVFDGNSGVYGGAMYNAGAGGLSSPSLTDVTFSNNSASSWGGAVYNGASGPASHSNPSFQNVTFDSNHANSGFGGAVLNDGTDGGQSNPSFTDVTFNLNTAQNAGAMESYAYQGESSPTLSNVTFSNNSATSNAGALLLYGSYGLSSGSLSNVTFYNNHADANGGALVNMGTSGGTNTTTLSNVTFNQNSANGVGGAMWNWGTGGTLNLITLTNVILWGDTASTGHEISNADATATFSHSDLQDSGGSGGGWDASYGTDGGNNVDANPQLGLLTNNGGFTKTMALMTGSGAIDLGDDTACGASPVNGLDQRNVSRPRGSHCDMGAYERIPEQTDFDGDQTGDIATFNANTGVWSVLKSGDGFGYDAPFFISWGMTGDTVVRGDFDGDRKLDATVRRPPASGQSSAYMALLSSTNYDYGSALIVPAGWPGLGDTPAVGDFNGDGIDDPAIFRGNTGAWIIPLSPNFNTYQFYSWGMSGDIPVAADVDGDGQTDIGYWRSSTGLWGFLKSSAGYGYGSAQFFSWGSSSDAPAMADYDGDGKADPAFVTPPSGGQSAAFRILPSTANYDYGQSVIMPAGWPGLGDTPAPRDYDGDGKADAGFWRGSTGVWIIPKSSTDNASYLFAAWGTSGDQVIK